MHLIEGGRFVVGSDNHYPEEAPARMVEIDAFWIDEVPVTNAEFARFVAATGYFTTCEIAPDPKDYPGILPEMIRPGSLVFVPPYEPVPSNGPVTWWTFCFGADWRHPAGPASSIETLQDHPVVHVTHADATAYAVWAGKALPSEAQWEVAARGGLDRAAFAWGDELAPGGRMLANYWQGEFPRQNLALDGFVGTSPVRSFLPNGLGLFDMIANVWEWTDDWFEVQRAGAANNGCCTPRNPRGDREEASFDPATRDIRIGRKVLKGGSHLCAENYCRRYRPAARYPQPIDTSTSHVGFRCVKATD